MEPGEFEHRGEAYRIIHLVCLRAREGMARKGDHLCVAPGDESFPAALAALQAPDITDWDPLDARDAIVRAARTLVTKWPYDSDGTSGPAMLNLGVLRDAVEAYDVGETPPDTVTIPREEWEALVKAVEALDPTNDATIFRARQALSHLKETPMLTDEWKPGEPMDVEGFLTYAGPMHCGPAEEWDNLRRDLQSARAELAELREVWSELTFMRDEYGRADDDTLTDGAKVLKQAITLVWGTLFIQCPAALSRLAERGVG